MIVLFLMCFFLSDSSDSEAYVIFHKDYAQIEMQRTGIPASIKLAQGLLETNSGHSKLSRESNNHFGIKCKSYWKGKTYYHKDDDTNQQGQLIKSCFRAYNSTLESYVDHSNFIKNSPNYSKILSIKNASYTDWARGLQYYGYATDKKYADKLIAIIDKFGLYKYDNLKQKI